MKKAAILIMVLMTTLPVNSLGAKNAETKIKLYVIGMGCGDEDLLTIQAIEHIKKSDAVVCMSSIKKTFSHLIKDKPILFDPLLQVPRFYRKEYPSVSKEESIIKAEELYKNNIKLLKKKLARGKTIALLEPGDPTLFGGWRKWLFPHFKKSEIKVIPGVSSFSAANALFNDGTVTSASIVITEPKSIIKNPHMIKNAYEKNNTIVIFMGLNRVRKFLPVLKKYYPGKTPVYIVYDAGISKSERKVKTDLNSLYQTVQKNREFFRGLIYVGRHLE